MNSRKDLKDPLFITEMMNESGLIYQPLSMNIKKDDLINSLLNLKKFVKSKDKLWYTIIDDSEINLEWIKKNISELKFN